MATRITRTVKNKNNKNNEDYVTAIEEMLHDTEFYQTEPTDKNKEFADNIKRNVEDLEKKKYITDKEKKFLLDDLDEPRTPIFYGLPKIHKLFTKIPPMRPIVSGYQSCTAKLSEFLDSFLKHQAQRCKSYIKDTTNFLVKLQSLKNLPSNTVLVTMDVSSLYTNIDQEEGAEACYLKLEQRKYKSIPSLVLKKLILLVLRCNISISVRILFTTEGYLYGYTHGSKLCEFIYGQL